MAYTLQDFRELVRLQLDTDEDDLPDRLVDVWVREAWRWVTNRNRRWPFYRSDWSLSTAATVTDYPLAGLTVGGSEPHEVDAVVDDRGIPLRWVGAVDGVREFGVTSGRPQAWTVDGDTLRVFPNPDGAYVLAVSGFRKPVEWVDGANSGATSDLPDVFDDVMLEWVVGRAFQRQEDGDLGVMHLDQAEVLLRGLQRRFMRQTSAHPLVLNGGVERTAGRTVVWNL